MSVSGPWAINKSLASKPWSSFKGIWVFGNSIPQRYEYCLQFNICRALVFCLFLHVRQLTSMWPCGLRDYTPYACGSFCALTKLKESVFWITFITTEKCQLDGPSCENIMPICCCTFQLWTREPPQFWPTGIWWEDVVRFSWNTLSKNFRVKEWTCICPWEAV